MGKISGNSSNSVVEYTWSLLNPRIEIFKDEALFFAEVNAKTDLFSITRDVEGSVKVTYDEKKNLIVVAVDKADIILDVCLLYTSPSPRD